VKEVFEIGKPDYKHSILNLTNSVLKHYGAEFHHETLPMVDELLNKQYKNVVVMVFDGMGSENLKNILSSESFLRSHLRDTITSVFPATTTAATTTLCSGLSPAEHGWLGWSLHFDEVADNVNLFPNTNYSNQPAADYKVADRYLPYKTVTWKINQQKNAEAFEVSPFGNYPVKTFDEFLGGVQEICERDGNHYIYAYWPEPDQTMHLKGVEHDASIDWIARINLAVKELSKRLNDTLILVTADHGHIDGTNDLITEYPAIVDTLKWLPTIEPRAISFHVKEGRGEEFEQVFQKHFGESFLLYTKEQVMEEKLFGDGKVHQKFEDFVGDYLAISVSDVCIYNTEEEYCEFIGAHAGITKQEMMVPLIVIECV